MSFKLTKGLLFDESFLKSIESLNRIKMTNHTALKVMKITNYLHRVYDETDKRRISILEEVAVKNNDGVPKIKKGEYVIKDKELLNSKMIELMKQEVKIDIDVTVDEITSLGISPVELQAIGLVSPIFSEKKGEE